MLSGDTGQRALAAFSLGWEPALSVSGDDWEAPLLAYGLDDRYAAIRFIAHRSLTHLPGFQSFSYDFECAPEQQAEAKQRALGRWRAQAGSMAGREQTLTGPGASFKTNMFSQLLEHRDNHPVHLRE